MSDYVDDLFVWAIIIAISIILLMALLKRKRLFIVILGLLLVLAALPIGIMAELSISGCCGAPSTGNEGLGYVIGGLVAIAGAVVIIFSRKLAKR